MVFDWIAREGWIVFNWWALVTLAGAAVLPLCTRLFGGLPDRGYTLARAVGMLLTGFAFWLLASLGFLRNDNGGILLAWLVVLGVSLAVYFRAPERFDWRAWWRENRSAVIAAEVLFVVLLLGWTLVRAHQNGLTNTEKPMDLMFISSIMRSPVLPPNDGWMADYSISYYYFGYLMAAMLSMMSGITSTVGFNMTISMVFALTGLTAFGVVYNLVRSRALHDPVDGSKHEDASDGERPRASHLPALAAGILATVMVVLMGNFQMALVEYPYQAKIAPEWYLSLTGTQAREVYPEREQARSAGIPDDQPVTLGSGKPDPTAWEFWWWFRASRVLNDYQIDGQVQPDWYAQPIDEFPQFSFLLADNHPHVLALPFVLLALGMALNVLLLGRAPNTFETIFYALGIGALVFLNTWDGPIYLAALVGAEGLRRLMRGQGRLTTADLLSLVRFGAVIVGLMVLFYLPFIISFRSQASGLLPNIIAPTFFQHFFIMFGPFILILAFFLMVEAWRGGWRFNRRMGLIGAGGLLLVLTIVMLTMLLVAMLTPALYEVVLRFADQYGGINNALPLVLRRRAEGLLTAFVLLGGVFLIIGRLFPRRMPVSQKVSIDDGELVDEPASREERIVVTYPPATAFTLLVALIGLVFVLTPEFFYLRDNFGTRINTIFKFYLQAWVVFSVASAYAVFSVLSDSRFPKPVPVVRGLFGVVAFVAVGLGLLYPVFGIHQRMFIESGRAFNPTPLTLDGGTTLVSASDYQSIRCFEGLALEPDLVVAEALGPAYNSGYGRVAGLTGVPIVLGWENHERQWRGATYGEVAGSRGQDIPLLYTDLRWESAQEIIRRYSIDYIFYGASERASYSSAGEDKFRENLEAVCAVTDDGGRPLSVFYRVTDPDLAAVSQ